MDLFSMSDFKASIRNLPLRLEPLNNENIFQILFSDIDVSFGFWRHESNHIKSIHQKR